MWFRMDRYKEYRLEELETKVAGLTTVACSFGRGWVSKRAEIPEEEENNSNNNYKKKKRRRRRRRRKKEEVEEVKEETKEE